MNNLLYLIVVLRMNNRIFKVFDVKVNENVQKQIVILRIKSKINTIKNILIFIIFYQLINKDLNLILTENFF
jgi:hypothetical protein